MWNWKTVPHMVMLRYGELPLSNEKVQEVRGSLTAARPL